MPSSSASVAMCSCLRTKVNALSPIASSKCLATLYWLTTLPTRKPILSRPLSLVASTRALIDEHADRHAPEGCDPVNALGLAQLIDGLACDHAAVAHHHQLLDAEVFAQPLDLGHEGLAVGDIALLDD